MKNLNNIFGSIAIAFTLFLTNCADPCKNIACFNRTCDDGKCICDEGYSGEFCHIAVNNKFLGSFLMTGEVCTQTGEEVTPYPIKIEGSMSEPFTFEIEGLYEDLPSKAIATISTDGVNFTIPRMDFDITSFQIEGSGSIDETGDIISIIYSMYNKDTGDLVENCTSNIIRK